MNTYEIFFTRENGTTGSDRFTAPDEKQARKDFRECYRHSTGTITEVKLVSENVPASKEQERTAGDDAEHQQKTAAGTDSGCGTPS